MSGRGSLQLTRCAFSLVELLVVIGIITVLLAILLPALSRAREHARQVKCASNVRQITMSVLMYANEHKGKLPIPGIYRFPNRHIPVFGDGDSDHVFQMIALLGGTDTGHVSYDWHVGTLWPYVDPSSGPREKLFECPSDDNRYVTADQATFVSFFNNFPFDRNFSYTFNTLMRGIENHQDAAASWVYPDGMRLGQIVHSSHKILVVEPAYPINQCSNLITLGGTFSNIPSGDSTLVANRHFKRGNHGFADGHVESLFPEEMGLPTNHLGANSRNNVEIMGDWMLNRDNIKKRAYYGWLFAEP